MKHILASSYSIFFTALPEDENHVLENPNDVMRRPRLPGPPSHLPLVFWPWRERRVAVAPWSGRQAEKRALVECPEAACPALPVIKRVRQNLEFLEIGRAKKFPICLNQFIQINVLRLITLS